MAKGTILISCRDKRVGPVVRMLRELKKKEIGIVRIVEITGTRELMVEVAITQDRQSFDAIFDEIKKIPDVYGFEYFYHLAEW